MMAAASSSSSPIAALPPELLHQILTYLPVATILRFARTCKGHYLASLAALQSLQLDIFPRRIYGVLAFLNAATFEDIDTSYGMTDFDSPAHNQIVIVSPLQVPQTGARRSKSRQSNQPTLTAAEHREQLFILHNALSCTILSTPSLVNLRSLTLHIYHISSPTLTEILATHFPSLCHLHLNFSHIYIHDACLPSHYWTSPLFLKGSPIWNSLAGIGDENESKLRLTKLERLTLERAGITSVQLQGWVQNNPQLTELILRNVTGVDADFVQWLGSYHAAAREQDGRSPRSQPVRFKKLALESCPSLCLEHAEAFSWLKSLSGIDNTSSSHTEYGRGRLEEDQSTRPALDMFSLQGSTSVSTPSLLTYLEQACPPLRQITLPDGRVLVPPTFPKTPSELAMCSQWQWQLQTPPDPDLNPKYVALESRIG